MRILKDLIEINFKTPFIQMVTSPYIDTRGEHKKWDWVRRINNQKAVVIAALYNGKMVITKEYRVPLEDYEWGLPAGLIDKGETPEIAARREMKEETGLDIDQIFHVSPPIYSSTGLTNESVFMILCSVKGEISSDLSEASEDITTHLFSREELAELIEDYSKKFGAKAYLLMQRFVEFGALVSYKIGNSDNTLYKSIF